MVCLDALVYDLKRLDQGDGKNKVQRGSSLGSSPGMRYLDDSVRGLKVPIQVQGKGREAAWTAGPELRRWREEMRQTR